jgi:hypothetical protein
MPKAITRPTEKQMRLERFDPEGDTAVTVRQATQKQHEVLVDLFSEASRVFDQGDGDKLEVKTRISPEEIKRRAVYLTLADCNILNADGAPLFRFRATPRGQILDMTELEFDQLGWGLLPPEVADEIYEKVLEVNPLWGRRAA